MKETALALGLAVVFLAFQGCATIPGPTASRAPVPLQKANLEAIFEENSGLEVRPEDAKELRDYYRGGVQQKAKAETQFQEKAYPQAMRLYEASNEFLMTLLNHIDTDSAEYPLFEGTDILFFPNLLMADNHLKIGLILREMGREGPARSHWKKGLSFVKRSLKSEPTEWGLALQQQLNSLLAEQRS